MDSSDNNAKFILTCKLYYYVSSSVAVRQRAENNSQLNYDNNKKNTHLCILIMGRQIMPSYK